MATFAESLGAQSDRKLHAVVLLASLIAVALTAVGVFLVRDLDIFTSGIQADDYRVPDPKRDHPNLR